MVGVAIGAAVVGTVGSTVASTSATKSASKTAKNTAAANDALQSQIYNENEKTLSPFVGRGNAAGDAINNLLGIGGTSNSGPNWDTYLTNNPDVANAYKSGKVNLSQFPTIEDYAQWHYNTYGKNEGRALPQTMTNTATGSQDQAFQNYENSTGYQWQLGQGLKSVQAALGAKGLLDSGAAQKSLNDYAQNQALTGFNSYLAALQGQQQTGLGAASAQAGVGTNYANAVTANNNTAATAQENAALTGANTITGALGNLTSAVALGSSYGGGLGGDYSNYGLGKIY